MEQMNVDESQKVAIDFDDENLPKSAALLQPLIYFENGKYHALLGPDLTVGIVGTGRSPYAAIQEWDVQLNSRLANPLANDEVIQYVKDIYKAKDTEVW
jgi:hypothetical protein